MGEINLSRGEQDAIKAVDAGELDRLLDECLQDGRLSRLHQLGLSSCGPYISAQLRALEQALTEFAKAKAPKKRSETEDRARRAASNLEHAVQQMKYRAETELQEGQLFHVDDQIIPPTYLTEQLDVHVSYRWRRAIEDPWTYGSITVSHDADLRPDYTLPIPKQKPSAAKKERDLQDKLYREWEHLMRLALYSVRDFFRKGGDGNLVPKAFQAKLDPHTRGLNNFSAQFWVDQPSAAKD